MSDRRRPRLYGTRSRQEQKEREGYPSSRNRAHHGRRAAEACLQGAIRQQPFGRPGKRALNLIETIMPGLSGLSVKCPNLLRQGAARPLYCSAYSKLPVHVSSGLISRTPPLVKNVFGIPILEFPRTILASFSKAPCGALLWVNRLGLELRRSGSAVREARGVTAIVDVLAKVLLFSGVHRDDL